MFPALSANSHLHLVLLCCIVVDTLKRISL